MPATKLTDSQLVILSAASQREDRGVVLPASLKGGAAQKFFAKLIDRGLIEEVRARGDLPVWRRDDDNRPMALRITKRGLNAIAVEEADDAPSDSSGGAETPDRHTEGAIIETKPSGKKPRRGGDADSDAA